MNTPEVRAYPFVLRLETLPYSVADLFWPLDPDLGSQNHIFEKAVTIFWVKSSIFLLNWPKFFSSSFQKWNNFQFCEICGFKKRYDNKFFVSHLFLVAVFGSRIRDKQPGSATLLHYQRLLIYMSMRKWRVLYLSSRLGVWRLGRPRRMSSSLIRPTVHPFTDSYQ